MKRFCIGRYCVVCIYRKECFVSWVCILFVAGGGYSLGSAPCPEWRRGPQDSIYRSGFLTAWRPWQKTISGIQRWPLSSTRWQTSPSSAGGRLPGEGHRASSAAFSLCFHLENHWAAWARFRFPAQTIITLVGGVEGRVGLSGFQERR